MSNFLANTSGASLIEPMLVMMLITLVVWVWMYVRRLSHMQGKGLAPQAMARPEVEAKFPDEVVAPSNNLRNLFELPVLFYALCVVLIVSVQVDDTYVYTAWGFVILRGLHSLIHCTVNVVMARFTAYLLSGLCLWFMLVRAAIELL